MVSKALRDVLKADLDTCTYTLIQVGEMVSLLRRQMKCSDRNKQCNSNCKLYIHVGTRSTPEVEIAGIYK